MKGNILFLILFGFAGISFGILRTNISLPKNHPNHYSHRLHLEEKKITLKINSKLKAQSYRQTFIAEILRYADNQSTGKVLLIIQGNTTKKSLEIGDRILFMGKLEAINGPLNPGQFSYKKYMALKGVYHQTAVKSTSYINLKSVNPTSYHIENTRNNLLYTIDKLCFNERESGILKALLLGERNYIDQETFSAYKKAGALHLLAVSGLHIGIVLLLLKFVLSPLKYLQKGNVITTALIVLILWFYAFLCGFTPSVIRAVSMFSFVAYGLYLKRVRNSFNLLGLSILFILVLLDPFLLFQVGFQLSYAAVVSIFWIYPKIYPLWKSRYIITNKLWQLIALSLAAQIGVFPLILYYFNEFPLHFLLVNIAVIPFLGIILGTGFLLLILASFNLFPSVLLQSYQILIWSMNEVILGLGKQKAFILKRIYLDGFGLVLLYVIIVLIFHVYERRNFFFLRLTGLCIILFQVWNSLSLYIKSNEQELLILHTPGKTTLLKKEKRQPVLYSTDTVVNPRLLDPILSSDRLKELQFKKLKNVYVLKGKHLILINNASFPINSTYKTHFLLLTNSPKINLNRCLDSLQPKMVIADGSNYTSYVKRWKTSCRNKSITFYATSERGALAFGSID